LRLDRALTPAEVAAEPEAVVWASASVERRVRAALPLPVVAEGHVPAGARTVVAIGGGGLIDRAKAAVKRDGRARRLVAVPSRWGSGAEVSPVIVLDAAAGKSIAVDAAFVPDARGVWPELAATVGDREARDGCADVWAHALEALVSPLADDAVRTDARAVLDELAGLPARDPRWFDAGARACAVQARAGVGLVHGIAHVLEPRTPFGHAALVAAWLAPCWDLVRRRRGVDAAPPGALFNAEVHRRTATALQEHWPAVLRDPCTRTNGARVRRDDLGLLTEWSP
jgi:alcohol dehydrogenase class IV